MNKVHYRKYVNTDRPVFFSYAHNSSRKPEWNHIADCVDQILATFRERGIEYRVDVRDIGAGDSISDFEREIGWNSEVVVLVFSDKYFRSLHCMYEFVQIQKALKQHPEKRLFCIQSGDVDITDIRYIMDLAHYWGKIKQEYDTIEFHHLRNHSGTEQAAYENDFYLETIRDLNLFFSNKQCYDGRSDTWSWLADEIARYYAHTYISFLHRIREKKAKIANTKSLGCGFSILLAIIIGIILFDFYVFYYVEDTVDYPFYSENNFMQEDDYFTNITKITRDKNYTTLYFHSVNQTDDTLRKVLIDTNAHLKSDYIFNKKFSFIEACGLDNEKLPLYYPGGKGSYVNYKMKFEPINGGEKSFSFIQSDGHGIFNLCTRLNGSFNVPYFRWIYELLYGNIQNDFLTIEFPEYSSGFDDLFITKIEITSYETVLIFHFANEDEDFECEIPKMCRIVANDTTYYINALNGIANEPFSTMFFNNTSMDFALFFPPIDVNTDFIDFVLEDDGIISNLRLRRDTLAVIKNPVISGQRLGNTTVTKVELCKDQTVLHFKCVNTNKSKSIFVSTYSNSFIAVDGKKYTLQNASGIPFFPSRMMIPAGTELEYALFFPPIPLDSKIIDFISLEYSRSDLGEDFYDDILDIFGDEYANETGDTLVTGIFGIHLQ